jgi:SAM-dependent methyltransferase
MRDCPICGERPRPVSSIRSSFSSRTFQLGVCDTCELGLVLDPRTDFAELYGSEYYAGRGADPLADYVEDERPGSIREMEWEGIVQVVSEIIRSHQPLTQSFRLLDWGAGLGGLVRTARGHGIVADGLDVGYAAGELAAKDLMAAPLSELNERYDIVTAIEVMEHLLDPVAELRSIASCLKPGGVVFITTGNFAKARVPLNRWYYAQIPDLHITFWTPRSWVKALESAGLYAAPLPLPRVDARIIQYKIIKSRPHYRRPLLALLPLWKPMTPIVDHIYGVSEFAIGVKPSP